MMELNEKLFHHLTREEERPVLVTFSAPWCGYCRRIAPALNKLSQKLEDSVVMGVVDIDRESALSDAEQIEVIPTLVIYHKGEALGSIVAPESRAVIERFIQDTLGGKYNENV